MNSRVKKLMLQLLLPLIGGAAASALLLSGSDAAVHKKLLFASGSGAGASGTAALVLYARNRRRKFKRQSPAQPVKAANASLPARGPASPSPSVRLPAIVPCDSPVAPPRLEIAVRLSEGSVVVIAFNFASKNSRKVLRRKLKEIQPVTWAGQDTQEEPPAKVLKLAGTFPVSLADHDLEEEVALKLLALGFHYNGGRDEVKLLSPTSLDWFDLTF